MPEKEARRVASKYEAHLATLGPHLPRDARRLSTDVSLHDGLLRSVNRGGNGFEMLFRAGDSSTGYYDVRLRYDDASLALPHAQFLDNAVGRRDVQLLYDEFDAAGSNWVHRLLFWPYYEVAVRFGGFKLAVTPAVGRFDTENAE
jgi:hypothetical protein